MPTRTRSSSRRAHSWSAVYRSSSGTFTRPQTLPEQLTDLPGVLLGEVAGLGIARAFGPDVGDGVLGVGQHQRPTVVVEDLDPVDRDQLATGRSLDDRSHDETLLLPGRHHALVGEVDAVEAGDELGEAQSGASEQLERVDERGGGIVGGDEGGKDEPTLL